MSDLASDAEDRADIVLRFVLDILRDVTGLGARSLTATSMLVDVGIESLAVMNFNARIALTFPDVSKTFLYDCRTVRDVAAYLQRNHPGAASRLVASRTAAPAPVPDILDDWVGIPPIEDMGLPGAELDRSIAIIGMSGRFPGATSLREFWRILLAGHDSVGEIPPERWLLDGFYEHQASSRDAGRSYAKWGGFLDNADRFDAQFFGIASREAALMDPQARLFLEGAWHALEDAALLGERTSSLERDGGLDIGVFLGQTTNTYNLLGPDRWREGSSDIPTCMPWSAANRVSFALNLVGPSVAIDTACSSSLVATHMASESLIKGECKAAIVGGVNLYLHPSKYVQLCQQQMLSPTGRCRPFSADADGFVPGEGVGVLVLKPLTAAVRHGDSIRAVIRGSAVRHGGRTNGFTVPSPSAQARVVSDALEAAGIAGDTVSYVEAHGTGTKLGDPIEIEGLKQALGAGAECTIGSVKSNIGHLEAAAGVASLIKVVLQLEHRRIAPSLHADTISEALRLEGTGLSIARGAHDWSVATQNGVRRAGVSSFGAGGANAHLILEEAPVAPQISKAVGPLVFPLSARSPRELKSLADDLRRLVAAPVYDELSAFAALAYTLQCGRRHFEHRSAVIASTRASLQTSLADYIAGKTSADVLAGLVPEAADSTSYPASVLGDSIASASPRELAQQWIEGAAVSWGRHWSTPMVPCEAPLYTFAADRHWIAPLAQERAGDAAAPTSMPMSVPRDAVMLQQHRIKGQPVLPAAAYIDLCAAAARREGLRGAIELKNPTWQIPLVADGIGPNLDFSHRIHKSGSDRSVEIVSRVPRQDVEAFHFRCRIIPASSMSSPEDAILKAIEGRCGEEQPLDSTYDHFAQQGIDYGPSFQCMKSARLGIDEALVSLCQIAPVAAGNDGVFDIGMLDGVLQSAVVVISARGVGISSTFVPFSAESIRIYGGLDHNCTVHVRLISESQNSKTFAFTAYGTDGSVRLEIDGLAFRVVEPASRVGAIPSSDHRHTLHLLEPMWVTQETSEKRQVRSLLLFDASTALCDRLRSDMERTPGALWLAVESNRFIYSNERTIEWEPDSSKHQDLLWRLLSAQGGVPSTIVFNLTEAARVGDDWKATIGLARLSIVADVLRSLCRREGALRLHIQLLMTPDEAEVQAAASLLRSLHLEIPTISATVTIVDLAESSETLARITLVEAGVASDVGVSVVSHEGTERRVRQLRFIDEAEPSPAPFQSSETFVLTGGMGSLGRVFATALGTVPGMKLALLGRSETGSETKDVIAALEALGAQASYWPVDCTSCDDLAACLDGVRRRFGPISGLVHCAGVLQDAYFIKQDPKGWDHVLRTKDLIAHNIDALTRHDPLRRVVLCSSLAGTYGNIGQSAYALANGWLDGFAQARNRKVASGTRHGETISIAWPLWDTDVGMQAPPPVIEWLSRNGLSLLSADDGRRVFLDALAHPRPLVVPIVGQRDAIGRLFGVDAIPANADPPSTADTADIATRNPANDVDTETAILSFLTDALSVVTGTPRERIDPDSPLEVFGLDSILVAQMNARLEDHFPSLPKTALFEARSLRALVRMLMTEQAADATRLYNPKLEATEETEPNARPAATEAVSRDTPAEVASLTDRSGSKEPKEQPTDPGRSDGVAIIGMAGRYPGAETLDEFWLHLAAGDDLVTEVPGRWTDTSADKAEGIYARWGGFVKDIDAFDPLFFGISPRDAERMDPQERLFLQTAYHAVEDAGYTPESLSGARDDEALRRRVAVIAGVMYGEYQHYGAKSGLERPEVLTNSSYASIANRVSFCLDLDGPSFAVDSMCSSSLTSIHLACQMLRAGSCEMALAGGVNLSLHPYKYRLLSEMKFASTDGKCRSFGEGGDGYVPGEGVGVFLLKPVRAAIRDGDHIYGVIRGSDINHGGRTSGYTVPNPDAQAQVIRGAFRQARVSPERLSYIEAHGTGTSLGDPIEIRGLEKAIGRDLLVGQRCAIGSVKANIGHLESAAGAAALTKVLLQFKECKLAPSIHSDSLNPNIDFSKSPFAVQRALAEWDTSDGQPRLAAISSMGAGGANAHMVVEEYVVPVSAATQGKGSELFLFSSRSRRQLEAVLRRFLTHLDSQIGADGTLARERYTLADVAATLRFGREAFETRLAVVASSFGSLRALIDRVLRTAHMAESRFVVDDGEAFYATVNSPSSRAESDPQATLSAQAQAWCLGTPLPTKMQRPAFRKVPLPGYEFQQRRFWAGPPPSKSEPLAHSKPPEPKPLTPVIILEQVASGLLSEREARKLLMAMR